MTHKSKEQTFTGKKLAVSVDDAADFLSVHRCTIYNHIRSGRLASFKMGTRTLVTMASIEALLPETQS